MSDKPKLIIEDDWKKRDDAPASASPPTAAKPAVPSGGDAQASQPPSLAVDSDWKSQAQAEKVRLAANERKEAPGGAEAARRLPPADFNTLVGSLVTQALLYLGAFPDPETGRAVVSLEHARFNIDLLGVLEEKTKGNLTPEEAEDLKRAIHELRQRYVEISQVVAEMAARKGTAGAAPSGVIAPGARGPTPSPR